VLASALPEDPGACRTTRYHPWRTEQG